IAAHARSLVNFRGPLLAGMVARGHEAHAAAPGLSDDTATTVSLHAMGVATHDIHFDRTGLNPAADLHALIALVRLMRRIRPDVSLGYAIKPVIWGTLAAALAGVAHRHALITGLGHAFSGEARGKRRIVQTTVRALYARALARAETVFFQNPDDAALFRTSRLVPPRARCVVVNGSGVDLDHFAPAPYPDGPPAFLMVSRLLGAKGSREYAAAARAVLTTHPQARFHLVGGFDPGPDCITPEQVSAWQDEGILTWHGPLEDVRPAIAATHVCVLPSYYGEGTPRCVLEAMAMGRPVITTDAPGCRETVVAGDNGFLVPVRQVEPLTAAMRRFLDDPALVARMGRRSAHIAEHKYDACKVSAVMLDEMGL
ncbi:MAG: glycosyltransferase family 4 protein, partial [Hyphomicrobiales bacterium]